MIATRVGEPLALTDEEAARYGALKLIKGPSPAWRFRGPGLVLAGGRVRVVLPRPCDLEHDVAAACAGLLAVLARYSRSVVAVPLVGCGDLAEPHVLGRVRAALELIDDHRSNGLLAIASSQRSSVGRIDWPKTISRYPSVGRPTSEVREGLVQVGVRRDPGHPLTLAHEATLQSARRLLKHGVLEEERASSTWARVVEGYRGRVFSDRARAVIELLLRFHQGRGSDGADLGPSAWMAPAFHAVWEQMLREVLGPALTLRLPDGTYTSGETREPGSRLRTDLILEDGGDRFILDAKDYEEGAYPKTADITKQMVYRLMHSSLFGQRLGQLPLARTFSAFLFPSAVSSPSGVQARATHRLDDDPEGWGTIACVDVDYGRVSASYVRGRRDPELRASVLACVRSRFVDRCPS